MRTTEALEIIYRSWMHRVSHLFAHGDEMRENFVIVLDRFFNSLQQAVETGDPTWINIQVEDWVNANTKTDIADQEFSLLTLLHQIHITTFEVARENLSETDALRLIESLIPIFSHAVEYGARLLLERAIAHASFDLEKANEALERLDRSKSNFIAIAAHELKTPLTLIEGYTMMLRDQIPEGAEFGQAHLILQGMDNGARRLRLIIDDMIDVSLIDNQLMSLQFQPVWINRLIDLLKIEFDTATVDRDLVLEIQPIPAWTVMTFGDNERLYQALHNVLFNSIKYTPDGGKITIGGRELPGFVEVTIADTGIGINPEDQAHIFDKFGNLGNVSLHSSGKTKYKGGGPGLGLSIARGIIEAHGGSIWVESPGYDETRCPGSTFHILLPLRMKPPDDKTAKLFAALNTGDDLPDSI